jgi:hypothetical protein
MVTLGCTVPLGKRDPILYPTNKMAPRQSRTPVLSKGQKKRNKRNKGMAFVMKPLMKSLPVEAAPVALAQRQKFPSASAQQPRRIVNSELIQSINGSVSFTANRFVVNPGLAATFPWLSVIAADWQQYRFHRLQFRYVTRAATSQAGSVILSPDYNPIDIPPSTEARASNTMDAVEDVVWKEITCPLTPSAMFPIGPRKQIRSTNVAGDLQAFDACRFYLCTVEQADTTAIGKLWVDYDVELYVPQNSASVATAPQKSSEFVRATAQTFTTTVGAALDFDNAATNFDPLGIGNDASGVFTPAAGTYLVFFTATFADSNASDKSEVNVEIQKNSASLTNPAIQYQAVYNAAAPAQTSLSVWGFVTCNGTDTVRVWVTFTSATGTLTSVANTPRLLWSCA